MATTELTTVERKALDADKATVRKGMATFVEVGKALTRIRDGKLYRETHKRFEDFCKDEFSMSRTYAHNLIESASAVENVRNCEQKPANESQARKLSSVPKEEQPAVWEEVVNSAPIDSKGEKKITAKHVESVVEAKTKVARADAPLARSQTDDNGVEVPEQFLEVFESRDTFGQIQRELNALSKRLQTLADTEAGLNLEPDDPKTLKLIAKHVADATPSILDDENGWLSRGEVE